MWVLTPLLPVRSTMPAKVDLTPAGIEGILRLRVRNGMLHVEPCIPRDWPRYEATITWRSARYQVLVENTAALGGASRPSSSTGSMSKWALRWRWSMTAQPIRSETRFSERRSARPQGKRARRGPGVGYERRLVEPRLEFGHERESNLGQKPC